MAEDELDLSSLSDDDLVSQMHDDLYDGLKEEIEDGVKILLDRGWTPYDVLTKAAFGGRRIAARVNESFAIPAESPTGKAEIHHIKVRFQPFIQR